MVAQKVRLPGFRWVALGLTIVFTMALGRLTAQERANEVDEPAETAAPSSGAPSTGTDYQASEQISEDLSVSFPIDI